MIRIGPSGWTHPGLLPVWPSERRGGAPFDPLEFLGRYFGCVEVDATAHAVPRPEHVQRWQASLAEAARTRIVLRLPRALTDLTRDPADRLAQAEQTCAALQSLLRREKLGALVAELAPGTIFGPSETRALIELSRAFPGAPLVLEADHASWYEQASLDTLAGAGWSLAHVEPADRWDAPPRDHRPTGPIGMLRLLAPGRAAPPVIGALARRARLLEARVDEVFVIAANGGRESSSPELRLAAALEIKYVLRGESPVPAWPEIVSACPHLASIVDLPQRPDSNP